jgi:ribosome-binding protein aMBF1 (putative translation factor)
MTKSLGQVVYIFKDKLVNAVNRTDCHTAHMAQRAPRLPQQAPVERPRLASWMAPDKELFARTLATRIIEAREQAQLTQEQVADKLGIRQSKYSKYENRGGTTPPTPMPHIFLARFCDVTGANLKDLLRDPR